MKAAEIRNMSATELEAKLVELKKDLFMLRMQHATNHLDNPVKISAVRLISLASRLSCARSRTEEVSENE